MAWGSSPTKTSVWYMNQNRTLRQDNPTVYIENLQQRIMDEFQSRGVSGGLSNILEAIVHKASNDPDSMVLLKVAYEFYKKASSISAKEAAMQFLRFLLRSGGWGPYAGGGESQASLRGTSANTGRNEARAEAEQIKRNAAAEAEQIKRNAIAEAEQVKRNAIAEAEQIKRNAIAEAEQIKRNAAAEAKQIKAEAEAEARRVRQEAQEQIQSAQNTAKTQADRIYENQKEDFVPRAVREMIEKYRREDADEYRKSDKDRERLCRDLEQAHTQLCDQVKTLQADMNDALNSAQNRLLNGLTQWRESFYKKEVMDLADCYVNLHRMLSPLDSQVAEAEAAAARLEQAGYTPVSASSPAEDGAARKLAEQLRKLWNKLDRFAKQLRNAMLGVGLDVYIPVEGDRFDPAQHTLGEGDEKDDMMENREIARCILPGVRALQPGGSSRSFESLIRAEVELKQGGIR